MITAYALESSAKVFASLHGMWMERKQNVLLIYNLS